MHITVDCCEVVVLDYYAPLYLHATAGWSNWLQSGQVSINGGLRCFINLSNYPLFR